MAHFEGKGYGCSCPDGTCDMNCRMYRIAAGKPSNADKIRQMTDEELAGYLAPCACPPIWFNEDTDCPVNKEPGESDCLQCWLDYLKQEAET